MRLTIFKLSRQVWLNIIASLTALSGVFILSGTLVELEHLKHARLVIADARLTVIAGLSLIYLGMLVRRGKQNAWYISVVVFSYLLLRNTRHFIVGPINMDDYLVRALSAFLLPAITLSLLLLTRDLFKVKSEVLSLAIAIRRAVVILLVAFLYGVVGFQLFDKTDFHQEIRLPQAVHYTLDQFGLTNYRLNVYTRRSRFFVDSLAAVSITSVVYAGVSFFAPVRYRISRHDAEHDSAEALVVNHPNTSEDFFKLWPRDKAYLFNSNHTAFLAYKAVGGSALAVGDPVGPTSLAGRLIEDFENLCLLNDWSPVFVHTDSKYLTIYKKSGFDYQKIGEEALIRLSDFSKNVASNKYFRHINNKFTKLGYSCELLSPPHSRDVLNRLKDISDDWLRAPGRAERTFMMGYFSRDYMQMCRILVTKDAHGSIQGFMNELPTYAQEANFDLLRHSQHSPGNINDYLMLNFINDLEGRGIATLNMGLAPLSGLDSQDSSESQFINNFLNFTYANGNRFYSFQGLKRFKSKYEPAWESRYIVYKGGLPGFGKATTNLIKAMKLKKNT